MMSTIRVSQVIPDKILMSRESAHLLEHAMAESLAARGAGPDSNSAKALTVDFQGIEGVAPSFVDELLTIFETIIGPDATARDCRLVVANPPTRLSSKFEAVARGHSMTVRLEPDGSWLISAPSNCDT